MEEREKHKHNYAPALRILLVYVHIQSLGKERGRLKRYFTAKNVLLKFVLFWPRSDTEGTYAQLSHRVHYMKEMDTDLHMLSYAYIMLLTMETAESAASEWYETNGLRAPARFLGSMGRNGGRSSVISAIEVRL